MTQAYYRQLNYIAPDESCLYLAVVIDLIICRTLGCPMKTAIDCHLVIDALEMAATARQQSVEVSPQL